MFALNLFLSYVGFGGFVGFACFCFLLYFFLLLFDKSSFYVLVIVSVVLGLLGFAMCCLLDLFFGFFLGFVAVWRVYGSGEMAQRATSLGPKPSFVALFCFWFVFFLFFFSFVFALGILEGFKGQVRIPEGPPHLAINPPYLFFGVLVCFWLFLFILNQKTLFSLEIVFLLICFLFNFPFQSPFLFLFSCFVCFLSCFLSFFLSLSLSLFLSFF